MRSGLLVVVALVVGFLLGAWMRGPLIVPAAVAEEKQPAAAGKGKCVGVSAVHYKVNNADMVVIYRAFEDGTVEAKSGFAAGTAVWKPTGK
jgi:hypothetical protein